MKPGTKLANVFEDAAGTTFPKFVEEGGSLEEALQLIQGEVENSGTSMFEAAGSIEAVQALLGQQARMPKVFLLLWIT